jgi:hypothetical protein
VKAAAEASRDAPTKRRLAWEVTQTLARTVLSVRHACAQAPMRTYATYRVSSFVIRNDFRCEQPLATSRQCISMFFYLIGVAQRGGAMRYIFLFNLERASALSAAAITSQA